MGIGVWQHSTLVYLGSRLTCFSGLCVFGNLSSEEQSRGYMSIHVCFGLGWSRKRVGLGTRGPVRMIGSYHDLVVANVGSYINIVHLFRNVDV